MKKILLLALPLLAMCIVACNKESRNNEEVGIDNSPIIQFKDPKFLHALLYDHKDIDKNKDGQISEKEASIVTELYINGYDIKDIDEISYFTALTVLDCSNNQLTSLDVSNNTALIDLTCYTNPLTSLDVSMCHDLNSLLCVEIWFDDNSGLVVNIPTQCPLTSLKIYKHHMLNDNSIALLKHIYGEIIEYVE